MGVSPGKLSVGIVGYGQVAELHAKLLREAGHDLAWVVGPSESKAARFAANNGFRRNSVSVSALLADERVNAVWICSPNEAHASQARASLEAGKHVLIEVPLAMSFAEGAGISDLAHARGLVAAVGH